MQFTAEVKVDLVLISIGTSAQPYGVPTSETASDFEFGPKAEKIANNAFQRRNDE